MPRRRKQDMSDMIVTTPLKNSADVNAQGGQYGTALQAAAVVGHDTIVATRVPTSFDFCTSPKITQAIFRDH